MMSTPTLDIDRDHMKTRQALVTDAIRLAILQGKFRPGDKLDQTDLAQELNVSRSPVREALSILTAEDLVTHYPHRGTVVKERSVTELEELLFIRKLLEGAAARRAAPIMTDAQLQNLANIIEEAEQSDDVKRVLHLNNMFHSSIYSAYHQPYLVEHIQQMRNKVAPYNRLYLDGIGQKRAAWDDHRRIYAACLARDGVAAADETCLHLDRVFEGVISAMSDGIKPTAGKP
ncbi:MAG: GntR family transcriptional regulator [Phototrophicaceae bacterium]